MAWSKKAQTLQKEDFLRKTGTDDKLQRVKVDSLYCGHFQRTHDELNALDPTASLSVDASVRWLSKVVSLNLSFSFVAFAEGVSLMPRAWLYFSNHCTLNTRELPNSQSLFLPRPACWSQYGRVFGV